MHGNDGRTLQLLQLRLVSSRRRPQHRRAVRRNLTLVKGAPLVKAADADYDPSCSSDDSEFWHPDQLPLMVDTDADVLIRLWQAADEATQAFVLEALRESVDWSAWRLRHLPADHAERKALAS